MIDLNRVKKGLERLARVPLAFQFCIGLQQEYGLTAEETSSLILSNEETLRVMEEILG